MDFKERYQKGRERLLKTIQDLGGKCNNCGYTEGLQFDHIDEATKLYLVSEMHHYTKEKFYNEVNKCQLLCVKCHQEKSGKYLTKNFSGENNRASKLSQADVDFIKENYVSRDKVFGARALARRFGVTHPCISAIIRGIVWK